MRIAYLECTAGIAGDMFLGALVGAGVPAQVLQEATSALGLDAGLRIETVDRSGIASVKVHVLEHGRLAEDAHSPTHTHAEGHQHEHSHNHAHDHTHEHGHTHSHPHEHEHEHTQEPEPAHSHEHLHSHPEGHTHGRSLSQIRQLISAAGIEPVVKDLALATFARLGAAEAKIHNVPVDTIHFHEVGAVDAIVDIVASCAGIHHLGIERWYASAVNVGGGTVQCAHGLFPVPAPAAADLLRGVPTYSAHIEKELVTPTGAALLRTLSPQFGAQPAMRVAEIGYGAGTRNPKGFPNVLRLSVGESSDAAAEAGNSVAVLETAIDDASPQLLAYVAEEALRQGALDVMLTPVIMKKGRPGTLLTVLCEPSQAGVFEQLLLSETTTLGVRTRLDRRACLERRHVAVATPFGSIRVKVGAQDGTERNAAPEFEDCRAAAAQHGVALKHVQQAAIAAYRSGAR